MNIEVEKSDIELIGHTIFNMNGYTAFVCNTTNCGIERILLRNILRCFGIHLDNAVPDDLMEDFMWIE